MINAWNLPESLNINGVDYGIRSDFRAVLDILSAFSDDELTDTEKTKVMIEILYYPVVPLPNELEEAAQKAIWFIDCGIEQDDMPKPRTMDWEQDAAIIFPGINKIAGFGEKRNQEIHWWGYYGCIMEISDGLFSQVLAIRQKLTKGKKLEKWEQEFLRNNRNLCDLKGSSDHNQEEYDFFADLLK